MTNDRQSQDASAGTEPRWKPIAQILVGLFIATQPYHGVAGLMNGEIDPSATEIAYVVFVIVLGLVIIALGVRQLLQGRHVRSRS